MKALYKTLFKIATTETRTGYSVQFEWMFHFEVGIYKNLLSSSTRGNNSSAEQNLISLLSAFQKLSSYLSTCHASTMIIKALHIHGAWLICIKVVVVLLQVIKSLIS